VSELRIDVADLLTHPGSRRPLHLLLEWVHDGIVARGAVHARWDAECSTCLRELSADVTVEVGELFEPSPVDGETYPIEGHEIDLEQLVRDAVLLELPLAPTCRSLGLPEPSPGLAGHAAPVDSEPVDSEPVDPRWAVLSELEL
jgi:uncharacterized protein